MKAHRAIEISELHMRKRTDFDGARAVNQDVDLTETLKRLLDGGLNLRGLDQIALNREDFGSEVLQLRFRAGEFFGIARDESDFASARANLARDLQAKTARAAGDERDFIAIGKAGHSQNVQRRTPNVQC